MSQAVLHIPALPSAALEAATQFHSDWIGKAGAAIAGADALAIVLPPAPYDHADWRRAAARDLARQYSPKRVNLVAGEGGPSLSATLDYLARAPGVTGQLLLASGDAPDFAA